MMNHLPIEHSIIKPEPNNTKPQNIYEFAFHAAVKMTARSLSDAMHALQDACEENATAGKMMHGWQITPAAKNGNGLGHVYSHAAHDIIYYEPGCPYGYTDCVCDPMRNIAGQCSTQDEMTPGKYRPCDACGTDPENGDECPCYDDEDK